ncbi:hypothetical protein HOC35_02625 [Candidatus Woesearchaeota archaeon]|nr:hypothetical protein [Candidatus Woesearchaeota archaeon]
MAKAKRKSSVKKSSVYSKQKKNNSKWIFLTAVTLVFVLLIVLFLMSSLNTFIDEQKTPTDTQTTDTQMATDTTELMDEEEQDLLGMAIGGFVEDDPDLVANILPKMAVINPTTATAYMDSANNPATGKSFTIQVEAYPKDSTINVPDALKKLNHFKITLGYSNAFFDFVNAVVYSDPGTKMAGSWDTTFDDNDISVIFEGQGKDAASFFPYDEKVILAEFTFKPKKDLGTYSINLLGIEMINSLNNGAPADLIMVDPGNDHIEVNFNLKVYEDNDNDGYGKGGFDFTPSDNPLNGYVANNQDCNDDTANDPTIDVFGNPYACPDTKAGCIYGDPNTLDPYNLEGNNPHAYYSPECAICQNPSQLANEVCDGIDNNCGGGTDEGVKPTCNDEGYECGVFYLCKGGQDLDCNNEPYADGLKLDGHKRCALEFAGVSEFCDVATGECVGDLSDCADIESELTQCQADLGECEGNLEDCYNNNPGCDADECAALGGECGANGYCVIPLSIGWDCIQTATTVKLSEDATVKESHPITSCVDSNGQSSFEEYACIGNSLGQKNTICPAGCDDNGCLGACPIVSTFEPILELTPACGLVEDDGQTHCNDFENCKTCSLDCGECQIEGLSGTACLNDPNTLAPLNDKDCDGVPDNEELTAATITQLGYSVLIGKDCVNDPDCDGDGVEDGYDYCPNTDSDGIGTVFTGRINGYGCYAADVGTGNTQSSVRPDGCFSHWDTTYYIGYYTNLMKQGSCNNVFGNSIVK